MEIENYLFWNFFTFTICSGISGCCFFFLRLLLILFTEWERTERQKSLFRFFLLLLFSAIRWCGSIVCSFRCFRYLAIVYRCNCSVITIFSGLGSFFRTIFRCLISSCNSITGGTFVLGWWFYFFWFFCCTVLFVFRFVFIFGGLY